MGHFADGQFSMRHSVYIVIQSLISVFSLQMGNFFPKLGIPSLAHSLVSPIKGIDAACSRFAKSFHKMSKK